MGVHDFPCRAQIVDALQAQISDALDGQRRGYTIGKTYIDRGKERLGIWKNAKVSFTCFAIRSSSGPLKSFSFKISNRLYRSVFEFVILRTILEREHVQLIRVISR